MLRVRYCLWLFFIGLSAMRGARQWFLAADYLAADAHLYYGDPRYGYASTRDHFVERMASRLLLSDAQAHQMRYPLVIDRAHHLGDDIPF